MSVARESLRVVVLAITFVLIAGCSSPSSPRVSGFAIGDTRMVSVGDEVVIRVPATDAGASKWRLTSFDSLMLRRTQGARRVPNGRGGFEWTFRFVAQTPGESDVELTRTAAGSSGEPGERRRFKIRING